MENRKKFMEDYLNSKINLSPIYDESLIKELLEYEPYTKQETLGYKANRVYTKCLVNNKKILAEKIFKKYGHLFKSTDLVDALAYCLIAHEKN